MPRLFATRGCLVLAVLLASASSATAAGKTIALSHRPFEQRFAEHIALDWALPFREYADRVRSPNGRYSFLFRYPDADAPRPWTSFLYVDVGGDRSLRLTLKDHGTTRPTARWINEELIFVRVWWGAMVGSDLIVDVPRQRFIYQAMFYRAQPGSTGGDAAKKVAPPPSFSLSLQATNGSSETPYDTITVDATGDNHTIAERTRPPEATYCSMSGSEEEMAEAYRALHDFLTERAARLPRRPPNTTCRNCTMYTLRWRLELGRNEEFTFSQEKPLPYAALDRLLPLMQRIHDRVVRNGDCEQ